jgi:DNA polymerase (family 10)
MRNADVARLLDRIADLLALKGETTFRVVAFQNAARNIRSLPEDIAELWQLNRLEEIHGVGTSIATTIDDYLTNGRSDYLADLERQVPVAALTLMQVPGLGPKRARMLAERLGIRSIADLIRACEAHQVRDLPGMGARTEENLLREAGRVSARTQRLPLYVAWPLADDMAAQLRGHPAVEQVEPAGSIRRRKETIGDIDLLVASRDADAVFDHLAALPLVEEVLVRGPTKASVLTWTSLQVDVRVVAPEVWGAALQYFTGSKAHNIHLRQLAIARGLKVNEYGIFRVATDERLGGATEAAIYDALGLQWMPPEIREDTGEIEAAAAGTLPHLVELADIRGDIHCHSTDSDGQASIEAMARAAIRLGYDWLVMTDHSFGLPVTQGLTVEKALKQRREIAALNRELAPFRILQGVELEIRRDGSLDFDDAFLATFDVVGVSLHMPSKEGIEPNTRRILKALDHAPVMGLNHPTGGIVGKRDPYGVDTGRIIRAAADLGRTLEINGSERLDLSADLARQARDQGVRFTLSSDAHSTDGLPAMRYAVALARRAWLEPRHVVNTLSAAELLDRYGAGRWQRRAA